MSFRGFFGIIFVVSLLTFFVFKFYPDFLNKMGVFNETNITDNLKKSAKDETMHQKRYAPALSVEASLEANNDFIVLTSLITSILSFLGFIISTIFSIKANRREEELLRLRRERERAELEKIQQELRVLKGEV
jgi:hypothetical protein